MIVLFAISILAWLVFASALNPLSVFFPNFHSPEALAAVARGHLHEPVIVRYWLWLKGMFSGAGFGHTIAYDQPVWPLVEPAFVRTLELMAASLVLAVALSLLVGVTSARRRRDIRETITNRMILFRVLFGLRSCLGRAQSMMQTTEVGRQFRSELKEFAARGVLDTQ